MTKSWLNLDQPPEELRQVHDTDYYWYLRSAPFRRAFIEPLTDRVNRLSLPVLDVGCGEGYLLQEARVPYLGLDGSESAIQKARQVYGAARFTLGRLEDPQLPVDFDFGTVVFGGIFSVLVKRAHYVDLVELYRGLTPKLQYLVIYDLETLDTQAFDDKYRRLSSYHASAYGLPEDFQEVKKHRKILTYQLDV